MAKRLDLEFPLGTTKNIDVQFDIGGVAVDITYANIYLTAKSDPYVSDANALFQISTATGDIVITNGPAGKFTCTIPDTATMGIGGLNMDMVYNVLLEIPPSTNWNGYSGYSGFSGYNGFSGFSGYSGKGTFRDVIVWGHICLSPNCTVI